MTAPIPTRRMARMLAAVEAERGTIIPFPENRVSSAPAVGMRCDGPVPDLCVMPPVPDQDAGPSPSLSPAKLPPHVAPFQRRQPALHVLIEAPQPQPLDPEKLAAIEWARRHRDGWDTFGVALAVAAMVLIAARCAPSVFPALFG